MFNDIRIITKHSLVGVAYTIHAQYQVWLYHNSCVYVTGPGKTGLIYTKYTCLRYGIYLLFCVCYGKAVSCIEFLMGFCIYDDIMDTILITDWKLLHVKLSKLGKIYALITLVFSGLVTYVHISPVTWLIYIATL